MTAQQGRLRWIYFLRRADGAIKIGRSVNPRRRLTALGGLNALEFLGAFMGDGSDEATLHQQFASARIEGEWFTETPELSQYIAANAQTDWDLLTPVTKTTRLTALPRTNKRTFGVSLNTRNEQEARLRAWLEQQPNPSAVIKRALLALMGEAIEMPISARRVAPEPVDEMTSQERNQMIAEIASLRQRLELAERQQAMARQAVSTETPGEIPAAAAPGPNLRPEFIAAVRAAAKPGIRLEDK